MTALGEETLVVRGGAATSRTASLLEVRHKAILSSGWSDLRPGRLVKGQDVQGAWSDSCTRAFLLR